MTTSLVKSVPQGGFAAVSVLRNGWQNEIELLVSQKRLINFDMYPLPSIPIEVSNQLDRQGYRDLVLESDQWQHFLVPNSK